MKKLFVLSLLLCASMAAQCKKYPFTWQTAYEVEQVRVADEGFKFVKAWAVASNADKAIVAARQNAVAACVFTGVAATDIASSIPPICLEGSDAYQQHKDYFDRFFTSGESLNYVEMVNSRYPTGENNVGVSGGRRVGVYLKVHYDALRQRLESDGIVKALDEYF